MDVFELVWRVVERGTAFLANLFTVFLGIIALYGLIWRRKELATFVKLLAASYIDDRVKKIKETLGILDSLNFNMKRDRQEILALLGQLSGQIRPLILEDPEFEAIQKEMVGIEKGESTLSEPMKRRILFSLHAALDNLSHSASTSLMGNQK